MKTKHSIINGDSRKLEKVKDETVQLVITSPPYWQLKDYGSSNQIGFNQSYEDYINNLNLIWQECYRVLENGCRLCINIGDQFARASSYGRYKVIPIRTEIIKFCEAVGFDYMGAIIWQKKTTTNTSGGASLMGSYPNPRNGVLSIDYEFILLFKKLGKAKKPNEKLKKLSAMTKEEWKTYFSGHWHFGGARQKGHIAMFPKELPHRLIKMFSFVGDTVLDPFLGSGTTSLAAIELNRNSIGYEMNKKFIPFIKEKLKDALKSKDEIKYSIQKQPKDYKAEHEKLPYKYVEPAHLKLSKKQIEKNFGSKINGTEKQREAYFSVKRIINAELIQLNNDLTIRLIGIKVKPEAAEAASEFLKLKTNKQKVYLKYDALELDDVDGKMAYLYLKNKTFLNAHLIKKGLALAETKYKYKHKERFLKYQSAT